MCNVRLQLVAPCAVLYTLTKHKISGIFLSYAAHMRTICYRMRRVRLQFATACAQGTLTIRYRMRRVRLQFTTAHAGYAYNLLLHAQPTLTKQIAN